MTMFFEPDIVIRTAEGLALVAEAKVSLPDVDNAEEQLKRYMFGMRCPIGLLVTPERMWIYQDEYTSRSPNSVRRVGELDTKLMWREKPPREPLAFELFVQRWLEDLAAKVSTQVPGMLPESLREYVLPAVAGGDVRAAHPRYSRETCPTYS